MVKIADSEKFIVSIDYTNWRGQRRWRQVIPFCVTFDSNEWHPSQQWLLEALDVETNEMRTFAMQHIHEWRPA